MQPPDLDALDQPLLSRQQRIADLLKSALPEVEAGQSRDRNLRRLLMLGIVIVFFAIGYAYGHMLRPLSYSEKMIVQTLIDHAARVQKKTPAEVANHLLTALNAPTIKDIKSDQMGDALSVLGQYYD